MKMFTLASGRRVDSPLKNPAQSSTVEVRNGLYAGKIVRHLSDLELVDLSKDANYSRAVVQEIAIRSKKVKMTPTDYFRAIVKTISPVKNKEKKRK